jgi:UMF1 family MFS transporter
LCIIYVLAPYIATVVIDDPVRGQALISAWHRNAGIAVALTAPFVGAATDAMGRRKPFLFVVTLVLAAGMFAQWWAQPGGEGLPLWALGLAISVTGVMFAWSEVLHNAMITQAAPLESVGRVSGLALALGNASSVLLLVFVLVAFALPGVLALPFVPTAPLFGLDTAAFEHNRVVAPLCAIWLVVFSAPLFLYARDLNSTGERFGEALARGVLNVARTIVKLRDYRNIALFLVARMLYADGKTAILIFAGVYAAGVMGWSSLELLSMGVMVTVFAVIGGLSASWLDARLGPKRAVMLELAVTILCLMAMVSITRETIFFGVPAASQTPVWASPIFETEPELAYLAFTMAIAVAISAAYASSRSLMARLAPSGMEGELFGLYAFAGSATAWLGPSLVEYFTASYQSQRAGFAAIGILLVLGFALLTLVKPPAEPRV